MVITGATESGNNSENMVINAVIPDSDSVGSALLKTDISQEASPQVPIGFQQVIIVLQLRFCRVSERSFGCSGLLFV